MSLFEYPFRLDSLSIPFRAVQMPLCLNHRASVSLSNDSIFLISTNNMSSIYTQIESEMRQ